MAWRRRSGQPRVRAWGKALTLLLGTWAAAAGEPFAFVQLTDPQMGMFAGNADMAQETANLEFAVATVNRLRPAFVVVTGDLVNRAGDAAQVAEYSRVMGKVDAAIPVYNVPGNHDVGSPPTPASLAAYTAAFGPDHYTFRHGNLLGIVLNSCLITAPQSAPDQAREQEAWLRTELANARQAQVRHMVVFQHHSWFMQAPDEADQYFNVTLATRRPWLDLLRQAGVRYVFCGHYHRNAVARDGDLEVVTTGPIGTPLGPDGSGLRIVTVREDRIEHTYVDLGRLPNRLDLKP